PVEDDALLIPLGDERAAALAQVGDGARDDELFRPRFPGLVLDARRIVRTAPHQALLVATVRAGDKEPPLVRQAEERLDAREVLQRRRAAVDELAVPEGESPL